MLFNRFFIVFLALTGLGGVGVGSKYVHQALYPMGQTWVPSTNVVEWRYENWANSFASPGHCIERMFPNLLNENIFLERKQVEKIQKHQDAPQTAVFDKDVPISGKPALGCVIMNIKKFYYGHGYWRKAYRGEVALRTEKEGWMWMMGQSTGGAYDYKQIHVKKNHSNGKWEVANAVGGYAGTDSNNLPVPSKFWHLDLRKDPHKECLQSYGPQHINNRAICQASGLKGIKSVDWTGIWVEGSGTQPFSGWMENPANVIFSWSPKNTKKYTDYSRKLTWGPFRGEVYDTKEKQWYYDGRRINMPQPIIWRWNDDRRGRWIELDDMCTKSNRSGLHREHSDAITTLFCKATKPKTFRGNTNYDNV